MCFALDDDDSSEGSGEWEEEEGGFKEEEGEYEDDDGESSEDTVGDASQGECEDSISTDSDLEGYEEIGKKKNILRCVFYNSLSSILYISYIFMYIYK